jgi:adenylate cyclase
LKRHLPTVLLSILVTILVLMLMKAGWLGFLENGYYDLWHRLSGYRKPADHVVIVAIDEQTLLAYQDIPLAFWGPQFAEVVNVLREAGAAAIGIDFLFRVSAESWLKRLDLQDPSISRTFDIPFRQALAGGGVALSGTIVHDGAGNPRYLFPVADYLYVLPGRAADVGLTNLTADPDGVYRRFAAVLDPGGGRLSPHATLGALLAYKSGAVSEAIFRIPRLRHIGYAGPPGSVERISMHDLLSRPEEAEKTWAARIKGKVVLVGAEHPGNQDLHRTPYVRGIFGWEGMLMSGVEIQANIVETLLSGNSPRPLPAALFPVYLLGVVFAATALFFRLPLLQGAAAGAGIGLLCAIASHTAFRLGVILPLAGIHAGLALAYLGTLAHRLTGEERRRVQLQQLFGRYVSSAVVDQLMASGRQPDLGGELFGVTVLFSDIRNFTTLSERLTPHEVVEMLNAYFQRICEPILTHGGTVDKFIGDAVMAVFGAPAPSPDHARDACRAALEMAGVAESFRDWMIRRFPDRDLPDFRMGIGIHSGEAVVGNVGTLKRTEYTAIGDTVNTAARMENASKTLGWPIVVSDETIRIAGPEIRTGRTETIAVKGRETPVTVHELTGLETAR